MTDKKITQLTALTGANAVAGDQLAIVDVSDTTMSASGTTKKIALSELQAAPLSAGTANGVAYLNGSKVLTTGSGLTFDGTNFATTGAVTVGTNTRVQASSGILFINGPSSIAFENGAGVENMRLTSTGLGIGTSSPAYKLDVAASVAVASITSSSTTAGNQPTLRFQHSGNNSYQIKGGSDLQFLSDDGVNERMRLDNSGNLLVGLTSATGVALLQVSGPIRTTGYTVATLPAGTVGMRTYVTDALAPAFGVAVAGSGAVTIPVFYDGANWIVA